MDETLVKKIPPHSLEAEQSVIGCMLYSQDAISIAHEYVTGEDFYQRSYGVIFDTLVSLYNTGKGTDIVTLQNELKKNSEISPDTYSVETLKDLANAVFTTANIRSYAEIVRDKATLRRMISTMEGLTDSCYREKESTEELVSRTETEIFNLMEKRSSGDIENISDITLHTIQHIEEVAKNGGGITGLESGFTDLDNMLLGFHPSNYVIIAARPSMGKTAFALNMAAYMSIKKHYKTALFELEMSREEIATRLLAMESHVDSQKLRSGKLSDSDWDDLIHASAPLASSSLLIDDTPGITLSELRSRCRKYKLEKGIDVVIVDYLQLMSGENSRGSDNRQQQVSEISRGLKSIARELNVPVIALSQLSRNPETRQDHHPMMADLRESGSLEQDADVVMFIYRDEVYFPENSDNKGKAELIVAKQRNGRLGTVNLTWVPELTKFCNAEKPHQN